MLDPFPPPTWFQDKVSSPVAWFSHLPALSSHLHETALVLLLYQLIHSYVSPIVSQRLWPRHYHTLSPATKLNWHTHVVSSVHSILISSIAIWIMLHDEEWISMRSQPTGAIERVHGYTGALGMLAAVAQGYFIYHIIMATVHFQVFGIGTLFHAIACCAFIFGFTPFMLFYYAPFLLFEVSNPFVNNYWFFKVLGVNRGLVYFLNGVCLFLAFFVCRVVWGSWQTVLALSDLWYSTGDKWSGSGFSSRNALRCRDVKRDSSEAFIEACVEQSKFAGDTLSPTSIGVAIMYTLPLLILGFLNYLWFWKIVRLAWRYITSHPKAA